MIYCVTYLDLGDKASTTIYKRIQGQYIIFCFPHSTVESDDSTGTSRYAKSLKRLQ